MRIHVTSLLRLPQAAAWGLSGLLIVGAVAPLAAQTIAITGGKVYPVSGPAIQNGTVLIRNGSIVAVGANVTIPADAQRIDATGKWVTPGLINPSTFLGVDEIGAVGDTRDMQARGKDNIAAAFQPWDGVNPNSVILDETRLGGITTFAVLPAGGLVAGQGALLDLTPGPVTDMLVKAPIAMVAEIGDAASAGTGARGELLGKLKGLLDDTKFYMAHKAEYDRAGSRALAASRADLEAMIPVVQGTLPVIVDVERQSDIEAAIRLAQEYKLKIIIGGGSEAWLVAEKLAAAHIPVLTGAMNNIPGNFAQLNARQENAGILSAAGVPVGLVGNAGGGDEEAFNARNIKQEAGNAVAYGMTWDNALKAVTLWPAEMFGVADKVGTLQAGREANVVVWSGDPFEFTTRAEHVFVRGAERPTKTRQDMLTEKYLKIK